MALDKDVIHKELDLIQDIIKRMVQNSFQVKAWLIGVLSALIVVSKDQILLTVHGNPAVTFLLNSLLVLPVISFWYLDAFFLATEKRYREVYKWVVTHRPTNSDYLYDLNTFTRTGNGTTTHLRKPENSLWRVMWSNTLWPFYVVPLVFVLGLFVYNLSHC